MKKLKLVILIIVGIFVYANIGYLFAYSVDPGVFQTSFTKAVYRFADFYGAMGMENKALDIGNYFFFSIFWPFLLVTFWLVNFIVLSGVIFKNILVWIFSGGIFRLLKLTR